MGAGILDTFIPSTDSDGDTPLRIDDIKKSPTNEPKQTDLVLDDTSTDGDAISKGLDKSEAFEDLPLKETLLSEDPVDLIVEREMESLKEETVILKETSLEDSETLTSISDSLEKIEVNTEPPPEATNAEKISEQKDSESGKDNAEEFPLALGTGNSSVSDFGQASEDMGGGLLDFLSGGKDKKRRRRSGRTPRGSMGRKGGMLGSLRGLAGAALPKAAGLAALPKVGGLAASALSSLPAMGGMLGTAGKFLGPAGAAAAALYGGYDGIQNAGENLDLKEGQETTLAQDASGALGGAASSLTFGLLDQKTSTKAVDSVKDFASESGVVGAIRRLSTDSEAYNFVESLEDQGVVDLSVVGDSQIRDWDAVSSMSKEDIEKIIKYDDWDSETLTHLNGLLEPVDKIPVAKDPEDSAKDLPEGKKEEVLDLKNQGADVAQISMSTGVPMQAVNSVLEGGDSSTMSQQNESITMEDLKRSFKEDSDHTESMSSSVTQMPPPQAPAQSGGGASLPSRISDDSVNLLAHLI